MTVSERIKQVQQRLSNLSKTIDDTQLNQKLNILVAELNQIAKDASGDIAKTSASSAPQRQNGCYIFAGDKGFYCPNCFDRDGTKAVTTRINSKLRICSICRTSIK